MTEIQNPKQKNNRFEPVWNLEFVILDTKRQGRAIHMSPGPEDQVFYSGIKFKCALLIQLVV